MKIQTFSDLKSCTLLFSSVSLWLHPFLFTHLLGGGFHHLRTFSTRNLWKWFPSWLVITFFELGWQPNHQLQVTMAFPPKNPWPSPRIAVPFERPSKPLRWKMHQGSAPLVSWLEWGWFLGALDPHGLWMFIPIQLWVAKTLLGISLTISEYFPARFESMIFTFQRVG